MTLFFLESQNPLVNAYDFFFLKLIMKNYEEKWSSDQILASSKSNKKMKKT